MKIEGLITAMITPFDEQEKIDVEATKYLIDDLIEKGVSGLFILGTNGEFHMMNNSEKIEFAKLVITYTNKRVPVYVGTGGNSTKEVIDLSQEMERLGADALSVISPYFVSLTDEELKQHYSSIAQSVKIPVILYNIPKMTGNPLSSKLVTELAKIDNILAIKDSSGSIDMIKEYIEATRDYNFSVLSGSDSLILKAMELGATGAVAATSNVLTEIDVSIIESFKKGDMEKAQYYQDSIEEFRRILKYATIPTVLKYALNYIGHKVGVPRAPISLLKTEYIEDVENVLDEYFKFEKENS